LAHSVVASHSTKASPAVVRPAAISRYRWAYVLVVTAIIATVTAIDLREHSVLLESQSTVDAAVLTPLSDCIH
jgi:hypothetical protein